MGYYQFKPEDAYKFARTINIQARERRNELWFKSCPFCHGTGKGNEKTFSINLETGQFCCFRESCKRQGNMLDLAREFDFSMWERISISATLNWMQFAAKTGLARLGPSGYENVFYRLNEEDQDLALTMINRTIGSHYARSEMDGLYTGELQTFTWNNIVTNDIPKIYIAVSYFGEYAADYDDELIPYAERLGNTEIVDLPGDHVIFLDRTEECIEIIDEFLNDLG